MPLDVEVAVNPEMLGKIFESMLPEYERGKKGTFYTPRAIVHYMCRESLKEHLTTSTPVPRHKILPFVEAKNTKGLSKEEIKFIHNALKNVKILDPAVGSGAFLVGMMQEILHLRQTLNSVLSKKIPDSVIKRVKER
jgi:type I restriction-modification system DNA methylase subunit